MINTITNRQMFFIILLTLTSYSIINVPKDMAASAGTGSWLVLFLASILAGLVAVIIVSLNNRFHGKMLFEYSAQLITQPGSYLLSLIYVVYFIFHIVFLVTLEAKLLKADFFPRSPLWAFPLFSIPVFCFIANKGINTISRLCELVGIVFIITGSFVHIIMLAEGDVNNILPLFNAQEIEDYARSFKHVYLPYAPLSVLLAIPLTQKNGNKSKKTAFFSLIAIGLFYILIVVNSVMKVGLNDIVKYDDSLIVAIRDTAPKFLEVVARLDILFLTVGFTGLFMGIAIIMTVIVNIFVEFLKRQAAHLS